MLHKKRRSSGLKGDEYMQRVKRRLLGLVENTCFDRYEHNGGETGIVLLKASHPKIKYLDEAMVKLAVMQLVLRYPILNSKMYQDDRLFCSRWLEVGDRIDELPVYIDNEIQFEKTNFKDLIQEQINLKLTHGNSKWLWRLNCYSASHQTIFLLTIHHGIIDGSGSIIFFSELLNSLANKEPLAAKEFGLPLACEHVLKKNRSAIKAIVRQLSSIHFMRNSMKKLCNIVKQPFDERLSAVTFIIPNLDIIKKLAFANLINTHDFMAACLMQAVANVLFDAESRGFIPFKTPVSLKKFAKSEYKKDLEDEIGCFISTIDTFHSFKADTNLIEIARDYRLQLKQRLGDVYLPIADANFFNIFFGKKIVDLQRFQNSLLLSTMGKVSISNGDFSVDRLFYCAANKNGTTLLGFYYTIIGNEACFCVDWMEEFLKRDYVDRIISNFQEIVTKAPQMMVNN